MVDEFHHVALPERRRIGHFFIQWIISSVIGTLVFFALFGMDSHFRFLGIGGEMALMPAYVFTGVGFADPAKDGPGTALKVMSAVAFIMDALYYGLVFLIAWRVLRSILSRATARSG